MPATQNRFPILFLGTQIEVAGAQQVLLSQARWFHSKGYTVEVAFFYDKQGLLKTWQAQNDFPIVSLDGWKPGACPLANLIRFLGALKRLYFRVRNNNVIVTFTPHSNLIGLPVARLAGVPIRIGTHHGYIEGSSNLMARLHGWLTNSRFCTKMVAVSEQVRQFAIEKERTRPNKLVVIENGIELPTVTDLNAPKRRALRDEFNLGDSDLLFLTVGRLTVQNRREV